MSYYLALLSINDKTSVIGIHPTLYQARNMVKNTSKLPFDITVTSIKKSIPSEDNMDGYYLISEENDENVYFLYKKKTQILKGWIYNSIDVQINKEGVLEIQEIKIPQNNNVIPVIKIQNYTPSTSAIINNERNTKPRNTKEEKPIEENTIEPKQLLQNIKVIDELKSKLNNLELRCTKKKFD